MRSTQEDEYSLVEAETDLQNLFEMRRESQDSDYLMEETLSADSKHSYRILGILKDKSLGSWVSETQLSETRAAKAQAWETQAFEAQARANQPKRSLPEATAASVPKHKPFKEEEVTNNKQNDVFLSRPLWSSKAEYILAQLGYSLRPVNFWRFIFLCLHSGGCSFFIIYVIMLFLVGIPLLFLEMAVGQQMNQDSLDSWKIIGPWSGGVGYTAFLVCFVTSTYVNVINSWILFYVSHSFQAHVPWQKCPLLKNSTVFDPECARTSPSMYYWYRKILKASNTIEDGGLPALSLSMPYFLAWCLVCAFMINGLKSTGKVLYILVPLSCFIIFCLLIRSLMLDGAMYGLQYLLKIKTSTMYSFTTWSVAGCQVLFDLGLGFGPVISLASHMPRSNNCLSDAFLLALAKIVILLLITPCLFAILGFWATSVTHRCSERNTESIIKMIIQGDLPPEAQPPADMGEDPTFIYSTWLEALPEHLQVLVRSKVPECSKRNQFLKIKEGTHFVIPTLVEVTSTLPGSTLWSLLLFLMMLSGGLSTTMGFMHGLIIPLQDTFSSLRKQSRPLTVGISMIMFLCGLFFIRPSGSYFIRLLNIYCTIFPAIFILLCENIAVAWAYGAKRFIEELKILWSNPVSRVFVCLWRFVNPVVLVALLVAILIHLSMKPLIYVAWNSENSTQILRLYPPWGLVLVVFSLIILLFPIPVYFVYCLAYRIPFKSKSRISSITSFKSLTLRDQKRSNNKSSEEEILQ
ncbi:orphan sodium- and chloride-dependent neurotransmitter transporter NTT5 [Dipodomys spectabilis]|uniref:orphan sodium- and chloride-dependent neurotransmitter transporter NTT5 n=1 Tax=Dipodomys spectabilis TaxID=105255 RepID=UPI001C545A51|nr:orphan sodium- and chloride-dependent neurotransmitter transporter NTT5 [Dipodomys spectabilis]